MRNSDKIMHHEDWQDAPLDAFILRFWRQQGRLGAPASGVADGPAAAAYVNQGRWVAECPFGCGSAIVASPVDRRFMCVTCWNEDAGGLWLPVTFPRDKAAIERELMKRPARHPFQAATRNWYPAETVTDLRRENALRGID